MDNKNVASATKRSPCCYAGRSSSQAMERGPGHFFGLPIMITLTYRGKKYLQNKEATKKEAVKLTYRRSIYSDRQNQISLGHPLLKYRGIQYQK